MNLFCAAIQVFKIKFAVHQTLIQPISPYLACTTIIEFGMHWLHDLNAFPFAHAPAVDIVRAIALTIHPFIPIQSKI